MKNIIAATLVILLTVTGLYQVNLDSSNSDFERWALEYGKNYFGDEKTYRQVIYYQNKQMIEEHNKRNDATYQMGENQFTAITNEEFINLYLNTRQTETQNNQDQIIRKVNPKSLDLNIEQNIKDGVDWRGWMTLRNQGNCASSYAIVISSAMEAEFEIKRYLYKIFSVQQIVDCHILYQGCDGNNPDNTVFKAASYIQQNGLYTENQYPYTGVVGICSASVPGYWKITHLWSTKNDEKGFKIELNDHPIQVDVDASKWQFYKSGVFSDCSSGASSRNYYALAVGYEESQYWIVQPSFGNNWGESGYIRLAPGNTCGLLNDPHVVDLN